MADALTGMETGMLAPPSQSALAPGELIRISGAVKSFGTPEGGRVLALDHVDLTVQNNEFLTLLGPSGCGKTTLLRSIAGFEDLNGGTIELDGRPLGEVPPHKRPFNTVFQSYALFPHLSVEDNVGYGLDVARVARRERDQRVADSLAMVGLSGLGRRKPRQLSGGQQQRVALARAIVNRPRLLLLDEPLSALDRQLRQSMQIELKTLQHTLGITFLYVTHDQEEALVMSDRIAVMSKGTIQQIDTPGAIYHRPANRFVAGFVGVSNILSGRIVSSDGRGSTVQTASGIDVLAMPGGAPAGGPVLVLIRPEKMEVRPEGSSDDRPWLPATIQQVVFVGSELHVHAALSDGTKIVALDRRVGAGTDSWSQEQPVQLHYRPSSLHVMADEGG
jgi:spermidine/putrescine transport system ATP-binding protein